VRYTAGLLTPRLLSAANTKKPATWSTPRRSIRLHFQHRVEEQPISPSRPLGFSLLRQDMTPEERAKAAEVHH
jgi:hypothetical protein